MAKAPDAFRTISEVADWLGIQAHVLRFWESKFSQVKPIKRAGGRRYYRPADMLLLGGIKKLLHDDGITIKGVQKMLREEGVGHVSGLSIPIDSGEVIDGTAQPVKDDSNIVNLDRDADTDVNTAPEPSVIEEKAEVSAAAATDEATEQAAAPETIDDPQAVEPEVAATATDNARDQTDRPEASSEPQTAGAEHEQDVSALPSFLRREPAASDAPGADQSDNMPPPPSPVVEQVDTAQDSTEVEAEAPAPKPANIDIPAFTPEADFEAAPAGLAATARLRKLTRAQAQDIAPSLARLAELRDAMARTPPAAADAAQG